jgi:hypothetical protein
MHIAHQQVFVDLFKWTFNAQWHKCTSMVVLRGREIISCNLLVIVAEASPCKTRHVERIATDTVVSRSVKLYTASAELGEVFCSLCCLTSTGIRS